MTSGTRVKTNNIGKPRYMRFQWVRSIWEWSCNRQSHISHNALQVWHTNTYFTHHHTVSLYTINDCLLNHCFGVGYIMQTILCCCTTLYVVYVIYMSESVVICLCVSVYCLPVHSRLAVCVGECLSVYIIHYVCMYVMYVCMYVMLCVCGGCVCVYIDKNYTM